MTFRDLTETEQQRLLDIAAAIPPMPYWYVYKKDGRYIAFNYQINRDFAEANNATLVWSMQAETSEQAANRTAALLDPDENHPQALQAD